MQETTLCYIEKNGQYLMLYRNKKKDDQNQGKWIGVGGKLESGETVEECLLREVREETGLELAGYEKRGVIDFFLEGWGQERMHLFAASIDADTDSGADYLEACTEGTLRWIPKEEIMGLSLWEGDKIFLEMLLRGEKDFYLTLKYRGDELVEVQRGEGGIQCIHR